MSMEIKQIRELQNLAKLKLNTSLAQLSSITKEENQPRAVLLELDRERERQRVAILSATNGTISPSQMRGMDIKWATWEDHERRKQLKILAQIAERREAKLAETQRAFGRSEALQKIENKLQT